MTIRRRLAALQLIDKMKQHEIETIGADFSALRSTQVKLENQSTQLREEAIHEVSECTADTRIFLPAYLKSVETRQQELSKECDVLEETAVSLEAKLLLAFRETKTNEMVLGRVLQEIALEDERAQTAELDDASRALYLLHHRAASPG